MTNRDDTSHDPTAVLLIAHGSRRQEANDDLLRLADIIRTREQYPIVEVAYLEVTQPTIPQAARACVDRGARRVLMLPYFLSAGEHVTSDLERIRRDLAAEFPQAAFAVCSPLGLHPLVVEVVLERLAEGEG